MKIYEIGTGYTSIPARMGAATEIVVEELTRSMKSEGEDVCIVDIKDTQRASTDLPIEEAYMPQYFSGTDTHLGIMHKMKRVLYSISLTYKLHKLIKKAKEPVALHFHNQYNLFFFLKLTPKSMLKNVRIGYTVHSYVWFGKWDDIKETVKHRYFQEVYCCQHADRVFVLNDIVTEILVNNCDVDRSRVVKVINGVNTDKYNNQNVSDAERAALDKRYHLEGKRVMFQVGSVSDRKNQLGTLKMLLPLMKKDSNIVMAYAGGVIDQEYADSITRFASSEGVGDRVIYMGEVSPGKELNLLYSRADVTFMNSKSEAFALVMAESLSAGTPVMVNEGILSSLIFLQAKIGQGVIRINSDTFEADIRKLIDDKDYYASQQMKGRTWVEAEYSWNVVAKQYTDNFKSMLIRV